LSDSTLQHSITRIIKEQQSDRLKSLTLKDTVAIEEPLEIRLGYQSSHSEPRQYSSISVTMRTPGNDIELALGFLYTEGILTSLKQLDSTQHSSESINLKNSVNIENVINIELADNVKIDLDLLKRNFYMTSSCGVCGKASIEAVFTKNKQPTIKDSFVISAEKINQLSQKLHEQQKQFQQTGGIHASALFNEQGEIVLVKEDVGRHNALDKVIGHQFSQSQLPLKDSGILVSGRASFELIQKAAMARSPMLIAVGAPSSLAIEMAESSNMTLIGFLGKQHFNIYTGQQRVSL
jgi:FdhD protein